MAHASAEGFPDDFVSDTAKVIRAIEDIPRAAAILADRPLDLGAQRQMRAALDQEALDGVNAAARRIADLSFPQLAEEG